MQQLPLEEQAGRAAFPNWAVGRFPAGSIARGGVRASGQLPGPSECLAVLLAFFSQTALGYELLAMKQLWNTKHQPHVSPFSFWKRLFASGTQSRVKSRGLLNGYISLANFHFVIFLSFQLGPQKDESRRTSKRALLVLNSSRKSGNRPRS